MRKLIQNLNRCSTAWGMYLVMQPVLRRTVAGALPMVYGNLHEPLKGKAAWGCVAIVHNDQGHEQCKRNYDMKTNRILIIF